MRKIQFILLLLFSIPLSVYAGDSVSKSGESLDFRIRYGFITGGAVSFNTQATYLEGKPVFHTVATAKTTGLIDQLYKLFDVYESYYNKETGLPQLSIRNISEGKYRFYDEVTYFQDDLFAVSQRMDTIIPLEKPTYDVVSAIYHLRSMNFDEFEYDQIIEITTLFDDKPFPMFVVYKGKELVNIGGDEYKCHRFMPVIDPGKIFQKKENMIIWFSDDKNKIPIKIRFNLLVGAFRLELDKYENLAYPFDAKIK